MYSESFNVLFYGNGRGIKYGYTLNVYRTRLLHEHVPSIFLTYICIKCVIILTAISAFAAYGENLNVQYLKRQQWIVCYIDHQLCRVRVDR